MNANLKKLLALGMAGMMSLSMTACGGGDEPAPEAEGGDTENPAAVQTVEAGKLHMSTNASFPPYEMVADDGQGYNGTGFEGIDIEVAGAIAEKLGLELVVDDMGFDAALQAAQEGKSDMIMAGVTVTEERLLVMDFTDSYAKGVQSVIVTEDSPIATIDDLATANMIGCQMGTTGYIYCSDTVENGGYGDDHVTAYEDGAAAVQALLAGQIDAVVIDNMPAQSYVEANAGLKLLDSDFANEDYAIGVAKGNTQMLDAINGALAELTANGTLQGIVDKYIPAN